MSTEQPNHVLVKDKLKDLFEKPILQLEEKFNGDFAKIEALKNNLYESVWESIFSYRKTPSSIKFPYPIKLAKANSENITQLAILTQTLVSLKLRLILMPGTIWQKHQSNTITSISRKCYSHQLQI